MHTISVIVPYHSGSIFLDICLESILKDKESIHEIIVVSNNSDTRFHKTVPDHPNIKTVRIDKNLGYAGAINYGASIASGDFLIFCDADVFFPFRGWASAHLQAHLSNSKIGITSSKLINYRTNRVLDFGIGRTCFNHFHPYLDLPLDNHLIRHSRKVQMACSASMMIYKKLFLEIGGFDENLFYHYQDVDLCLQLKRKNMEIWVLADTIAYHRSSSAKINREPFQVDERGYYTAKNIDLLEVDYPKYLVANLEHYEWHLTRSSPYGLVDLSTLTNPMEALEIIKHFTDWVSLFKRIPSRRDLKEISLLDYTNSSTLSFPHPLLILVDRYSSLHQNALWAEVRNIENDIVVDRHANVRLFNELMAERR